MHLPWRWTHAALLTHKHFNNDFKSADLPWRALVQPAEFHRQVFFAPQGHWQIPQRPLARFLDATANRADGPPDPIVEERTKKLFLADHIADKIIFAHFYFNNGANPDEVAVHNDPIRYASDPSIKDAERIALKQMNLCPLAHDPPAELEPPSRD